MIVKNINNVGRILRGALGVVCLAGAAGAGPGTRMLFLIAVGALLILQAAVGM